MEHLGILLLMLVFISCFMIYEFKRYVQEHKPTMFKPKDRPRKEKKRFVVQDDAFCAQKELETQNPNNQFVN